MKKSLVIYDLKNKNNVEKTHIIRSLFGYTDKSNNGNYEYKRQGLLSKIKHETLDKSVLIVDSKDEREVSEVLRKFGLRVLIMNLPEKKG